MDRLAAMETFVRVVETGSFSAAARRLNVGQPAVSKTVAQIEERLGVRLLMRSTHGLSPTEAGQSFYDRARGSSRRQTRPSWRLAARVELDGPFAGVCRGDLRSAACRAAPTEVPGPTSWSHYGRGVGRSADRPGGGRRGCGAAYGIAWRFNIHGA